MENIIPSFKGDTDVNHRHWTRMYRSIRQHPRYRSRSNRFPDELFQEGLNSAWAEFNQEKIKGILHRLEGEGIEITVENSDRIVPVLIHYFNRMAHNQTISIWRKESYLVA